MSLLYLQTRDLKNKIGQDIESQKCVLISKEVLDKYKNDNNYNNMKNSSDYLLDIHDSGYEEHKKALRKKFNIDENKLPIMDSILLIEINWSLEKQFLDSDNIICWLITSIAPALPCLPQKSSERTNRIRNNLLAKFYGNQYFNSRKFITIHSLKKKKLTQKHQKVEKIKVNYMKYIL